MDLKDVSGWNPKDGDYNDHVREMQHQKATLLKQQKRGRIIFIISVIIALFCFWYWVIQR